MLKLGEYMCEGQGLSGLPLSKNEAWGTYGTLESMTWTSSAEG